MTKFIDEMFRVLTKYVGRKGAVALMLSGVLTFSFWTVICLEAWRGQNIDSSWTTYCAAMSAVMFAFVGGNAAEYFNKRGQPKEGETK